MLLISFSSEVQWLEVLITLIFLPISWQLIKYLLTYLKYRKLLGSYTSEGKSVVTISLPLMEFGFFIIDCTESEGQSWTGKYKMNEYGCTLEGQYIWNHLNNVKQPDIGQHIITFSLDMQTARVSWKALSGPYREGFSEWKK